jgi:polyphosphate kinase
MKKHKGKPGHEDDVSSAADYEKALHKLQIELVKWQRHVIASNDRIVVIFEGRDTAGKDGSIKRIVEYLSPREIHVVALGKPSDRESGEWYFQRYVRYLPSAQQAVLFNRSWYNRAGVEWVMGFCTKAQHKEFLQSVPEFEEMLIHSGIRLLKYYLDISKAEQKKRLKQRRVDPLTQWKLSPIDNAATKHWDGYSAARNEMLDRTHTRIAPWTIVRADDKQEARINIICDLLQRLPYKGKDRKLLVPDKSIVFDYNRAQLKNGMIAP